MRWPWTRHPVHVLMSAHEAEASGYTVDRHCYPWIAYKGARFQPDDWFVIQTPGVDSDGPPAH